LRAAILATPVLAVVRIAEKIEALSEHPLSSYHRSKQGHSCEELSSNEYGGYTAFSRTVCRWRHSTALAIYYSESIFRGYEKDSWLYSPFQEVIKKGRIFHRAQWIITCAFVLVLG